MTGRGATVAAVVGIAAGAVALGWYALIFATGGLLFILLQSVYQVAVWVLAAMSLVCGLLSVPARRPVAITALTVGVVAIIVAVAVGSLTAFRIIPM